MNMRAGAVTREEPPFRAEHIGSLLRPRTLLQKRERFARGEISQADLTDAEDAAIVDAAALQERLGLQFATDGEAACGVALSTSQLRSARPLFR
jgi:5-methyltetrahydropteroyltriglutamate--homocysteine methyltransferase